MGISKQYRKFSESEGSQYIASQFAIEKLLKLIEFLDIQNVLEVGLGIGSISGIILEKSKNINHYSGTEDNEFCLDNLKLNLEEDIERLKIYRNLKVVDKEPKYHLIIIDGKDPELFLVKELITSNGILAVEGDRMPQQELLQELFPGQSNVHCISLSKNKDFSPFKANHWQGGVKLIFINPTIKQRLWLLQEKVQTKLKYIYRNTEKFSQLSNLKFK